MTLLQKSMSLSLISATECQLLKTVEHVSRQSGSRMRVGHVRAWGTRLSMPRAIREGASSFMTIVRGSLSV